MPNHSLADHIMVFDGVLTAGRCQGLIHRFEPSCGHEASQREGGHSFFSIDVSRHWPDEHEALVPVFLSCFKQYQKAVNARFWPRSFAFETLRLKRYLPNGRDSFPPHVDVVGHASAQRFMTAILCLNSVDGGPPCSPASSSPSRRRPAG
jgi:hypothetical protein